MNDDFVWTVSVKLIKRLWQKFEVFQEHIAKLLPSIRYRTKFVFVSTSWFIRNMYISFSAVSQIEFSTDKVCRVMVYCAAVLPSFCFVQDFPATRLTPTWTPLTRVYLPLKSNYLLERCSWRYTVLEGPSRCFVLISRGWSFFLRQLPERCVARVGFNLRRKSGKRTFVTKLFC